MKRCDLSFTAMTFVSSALFCFLVEIGKRGLDIAECWHCSALGLGSTRRVKVGRSEAGKEDKGESCLLAESHL